MWSKFRSFFIQNINDKPLLPTDRNCACCVGQNPLHSPFLNKNQSCINCRNLGRLTELTDSLINQVFSVQCGRYVGMMLTVRSFDHPVPPVLRPTTSILKRLGVSTGEFSVADKWTTSTSVNWIIESIYRADFISLIYTSFQCRDTGFIVTENYKGIQSLTADAVSARDAGMLKPQQVVSIVLQLLNIYYKLSTLSFVHGAIDLDSLAIASQPFATILDGHRISGPFTLKLQKFDESSILRPDGRQFINRTVWDSVNNLSGTGLHSFVAIDNDTPRRGVKVTDFRSAMVFRRLTSVGSVFDYYLWWMALMAYEPFAKVVESDAVLWKMWNIMWRPTDLERLMKTKISDQSSLDGKTLWIDIIDMHRRYIGELASR